MEIVLLMIEYFFVIYKYIEKQVGRKQEEEENRVQEEIRFSTFQRFNIIYLSECQFSTFLLISTFLLFNFLHTINK